MDFWDNDSREWNENESDREDSEEENELTNSPDDENDPDDPPSSDDEVSIYSGPPSPTNSEYTDDDSPENGDYEDMADFSDSDHYWDDSDHDIYYSSSTNHSYGGDTGTTTPSQLVREHLQIEFYLLNINIVMTLRLDLPPSHPLNITTYAQGKTLNTL